MSFHGMTYPWQPFSDERRAKDCRFTGTTDVELDDAVRTYLLGSPMAGLKGYFISIHFYWHTCPKSEAKARLRKHDSACLLLLSAWSLWHCGMIRWRLVIHGCIDGLSRFSSVQATKVFKQQSLWIGVIPFPSKKWGVMESTWKARGSDRLQKAAFIHMLRSYICSCF